MAEPVSRPRPAPRESRRVIPESRVQETSLYQWHRWELERGLRKHLLRGWTRDQLFGQPGLPEEHKIQPQILISDRTGGEDRRHFLQTWCRTDQIDDDQYDPTLADFVQRVIWPEDKSRQTFVIGEISQTLDREDLERVLDRRAWLQQHLQKTGPVYPVLVGPDSGEARAEAAAVAHVLCLRAVWRQAQDGAYTVTALAAQGDVDTFRRYWAEQAG